MAEPNRRFSPPAISFTVETPLYVCDRCGFSFRAAGHIWIVEGNEIYFCPDCQKQIDQATSNYSAVDKGRYVEAIARRLGLLRSRREGQLDPRTTAALLGLGE
jgi:hypothetical protein